MAGELWIRLRLNLPSRNEDQDDDKNQTQATSWVIAHPELYRPVVNAPTIIRFSTIKRIVP